MAIKRDFGTFVDRLFRGGTRLSDGEHALLNALVAALPPDLRSVVASQFETYNLVQREQDKRALNFYRVRFPSKVVPPDRVLPMKAVQARMIGVTAHIDGETKPLYATLTAVSGRAFAVSFDRPVPASIATDELTISHVSHAWRSSFNESVHDA